MNPSKLVFTDETSVKTNMTRLYGRAPRGRRLVCAIPHGHRKTSTYVGARRCDDVTASGVFDGAINGERFLAYVRQILLPALKPGDTAIMDNLPAHNVSGVREAIKAAGAILMFIPPYSPDLNPIELAFDKLKAQLRKNAIRGVGALWKALGSLAGLVSHRSAPISSAMMDISSQPESALKRWTPPCACGFACSAAPVSRCCPAMPRRKPWRSRIPSPCCPM